MRIYFTIKSSTFRDPLTKGKVQWQIHVTSSDVNQSKILYPKIKIKKEEKKIILYGMTEDLR